MGVGEALLQEIMIQSERDVIWTLQSGILADNLVSIQLHKSCVFRMGVLRKDWPTARSMAGYGMNGKKQPEDIIQTQ